MTNVKRKSAGLIGALTALAAIGLVPPAYADDDDTREGPPPEPPRINLVLDVSGSMRANDAGGMTRIAAAQRAFNEIVDAAPAEAYLGARVLGADYTGGDKVQGCKDTRQLSPVGVTNKAEIKSQVATLRPTGFTPIGPALRAAADDLVKSGGTGTKRIVLITDGEDTCAPPDACDIARELAAQGLNLTVDTLGLVPDEKTRQQLSCIASATGGTYTSVNNADDLSGRVKQLVQRAVTTAADTPAPVKGSPNGCFDAPLLGGGVYSDRIEFEQHLWYKVPLLPGQELRASASVSADRKVNRDYDTTLTAFTEQGKELVRFTDAGSGRTDVNSAGLRWPRGGDTGDAEPEDAENICVQLSTAFAASDGIARKPGLPVELALDVVGASDRDIANTHGLGTGWVFLGLLAGVGLLAGLFIGRIVRFFTGSTTASGGNA